ncbi:MAG: hypothetical protein KDA96_13160 [Planctomycetaceae bacterium]|nr:hypothetical protein [Planctomycetaceae bacterium]
MAAHNSENRFTRSATSFVTRRAALGVLALAVGSCCGCGPTSFIHDPGRLIGRPKVTTDVGRILALWEASNGNQPDGTAARGFAGQILFFGPSSRAASRVHGTIRITEYDNYSGDEENLEPLHTFVFQPEAWEVHGAEGTLGHTYNVFIPYINRHRDPVWCGLKVEFVGPDNIPVASETTRVMLPAKTATATATSQLTRQPLRNSQVRPAVHQTATEVSRPPRLESVTIPLHNR